MNAILLGVALLAQALLDVSAVVISPPAVVCDLDMTLMKGDIRRMSWSPDSGSIHIQTIERDALRDYIVTLPEGVVSVAFGEPEWAAPYWAMKSDLGGARAAGAAYRRDRRSAADTAGAVQRRLHRRRRPDRGSAQGRLGLFDRQKHKRIVGGTKDAILPAWSPDGTRVAFLQKQGRRNYRLMMTTITPPRT